MKNICLSFFTVFIIQNGLIAQPLEQYDFAIDFQIGYPNLAYWKSNNSVSSYYAFDTNNETLRSIGQFVLNTDFFLTDKLSLSLGVNYGHYYSFEDLEETVYDGNTGQTTINTYTKEKTVNRFRLYFGPNFHVLRTDRLDSYLGFRVGMKKSYMNENNNSLNNPDSKIYIEPELPIGLRALYGFRYFVSDKLAICTELGLGGPVVTFGVTYKIENN